MKDRILLPLLLAAAPVFAETVFVRITGDRVNLRSAPRLESEVVAQAMTGDVLALHGDPDAPWVAVAVPTNAPVWIYVPLLDEGTGTVSVRKAWVRAGASVNYQTLGLLEQGDAVEILETEGDWARIVPPLSASVYVTNAFIEVLSSSPSEPAPADQAPETPEISEPVPDAQPPESPEISEPVPAEQAPESPEISEPVPDAQPPESPEISEPVPDAQPPESPEISESVPDAQPLESPEISEPVVVPQVPELPESSEPVLDENDLPVPVGPANIPSDRLRLSVQQANPGTFSGILQTVGGSGPHPTRWQLVPREGESAGRPVCYVYGNTRQLTSLSGSRLTVSGAVYWFLETELPTVFAQDIGRHVSR